MRAIKKYFYILMSFVAVIGITMLVIQNYGWIFSKHVTGQVFAISRVNQPNLVLGNATMVSPSVMHSYAISVRTADGKIITGSGDDRQWEVVQKGICVDATFFPYPPWDLKKGGTYTNARLNEMMDCPPEFQSMNPAPSTESQPEAQEVQAQPE